MPSPQQCYSLCRVGVFVAVNLACTNIALGYLPIALHQALKGTLPALTMCCETHRGLRVSSPSLLIALGLLVGPLVVSMGENWENDANELAIGTAVMLVSVWGSAMKYATGHRIIREYKHELGFVGFTFWIEVITALILLPWTVLEVDVESLYAIMHNWTSVLGMSAFGGVRILSQFWFLGETSATSMAIANVATQACTALLGTFAFAHPFTHTLLLGTVITLTCSALYAYLTTKKSRYVVVDRSEQDRAGYIAPEGFRSVRTEPC